MMGNSTLLLQLLLTLLLLMLLLLSPWHDYCESTPTVLHFVTLRPTPLTWSVVRLYAAAVHIHHHHLLLLLSSKADTHFTVP